MLLPPVLSAARLLLKLALLLEGCKIDCNSIKAGEAVLRHAHSLHTVRQFCLMMLCVPSHNINSGRRTWLLQIWHPQPGGTMAEADVSELLSLLVTCAAPVPSTSQ